MTFGFESLPEFAACLWILAAHPVVMALLALVTVGVFVWVVSKEDRSGRIGEFLTQCRARLERE